jgi:hypothetical protein
LKRHHHKKKGWWSAQGIGPEFKPQYCKKKKKLKGLYVKGYYQRNEKATYRMA